MKNSNLMGRIGYFLDKYFAWRKIEILNKYLMV